MTGFIVYIPSGRVESQYEQSQNNGIAAFSVGCLYGFIAIRLTADRKFYLRVLRHDEGALWSCSICHRCYWSACDYRYLYVYYDFDNPDNLHDHLYSDRTTYNYIHDDLYVCFYFRDPQDEDSYHDLH